MSIPQIESPCLVTPLTRPVQELEHKILSHQAQIETWFRKQWHVTPPPFYASVDLRNCGFKLAPVDTNLFPAGFNNLNPDYMPLCIQAAQAVFDQYYASCQRLLLIPESHTRNQFYFESVAVLTEILRNAGLEVRIGSLLPEITTPQTVNLPSGRTLTLEPLTRQGTRIGTGDFFPCIVLLNNDLSTGVPEIMQGITQTIVPPLTLGWFSRSKATHFGHYAAVARDFAGLLGIDPWMLNPLSQPCDQIDFLTGAGEERLMDEAAKLFQAIQAKYREYGIERAPFVVIKADAGTYGMGVMMIHDPQEIKQLNRKERARMSAGKGGQKIDKVILQEGVYTLETVGTAQSVAEPVIYLIGSHVVGGFYRVHTRRGADENLNAPGMHFEPLPFCVPCNMPSLEKSECQQNRFYVYNVVARLALVAAAREQS